ncbi:MAG: two-component system response regulator [Planctomyces sp.]|nr:two-component system response regulator [Planctomyces sp.]
MAVPDRVVVLGASSDQHQQILDRLRGFSVEVLAPATPFSEAVPSELPDAVLAVGPMARLAIRLNEINAIVQHLPDGLVVLNIQQQVLWWNRRIEELAGTAEIAGGDFFTVLQNPQIEGPDFAPLNRALATGETTRTKLRLNDKQFLEILASPIMQPDADLPLGLVVTIHDITSDVLEREKLNAIHQAGRELGDLSAEELIEMSVEDRIELLKQKIIQFTQDTLNYETIEIRLLDRKTKHLEPLLHVGMTEEASHRELYASAQGNGVTGYVAATGNSYLCEETSTDPLYLPGALGACSSLTVPLILHDEVFGTFNVESSKVGAFSHRDLQFLELFAREIAIALNTLELLAVEKMTTQSESMNLVLREIHRPLSEILGDANWVLDGFIGHQPEICERLQRVINHTRGIRDLIMKIGEAAQPALPHAPVAYLPAQRAKIRGKRILVVDQDDTIRQAANDLLVRFGCVVEAASSGIEAERLVRGYHYDAAIIDIRLPDMTGFDCFVKIRQLNEHLPVILMTGFGYDPSHSIVKARQMGLKSALYKPFRLEQLLTELEKVLTPPGDAASDS